MESYWQTALRQNCFSNSQGRLVIVIVNPICEATEITEVGENYFASFL